MNDSFEAFESSARAQGFDEVLDRAWAPHAKVDTHTHPFDVKALIVRGELWLTTNEQTRHLKAGDTFEWTAEFHTQSGMAPKDPVSGWRGDMVRAIPPSNRHRHT